MSTLVQAEIISLVHNILITRDDFEHVNCVEDAAAADHPIVFKPIIVHVGTI
jgi:hypothetical protein